MDNNKKPPTGDASIATIGAEFFIEFWEKSWTYIKTVVDVLREPVIILDKSFTVLAANEPFYKLFQVTEGDTEGKSIYALGNGQWDTLPLRKLLEDILPKNTFFKGFEVEHDFPSIGQKTIILNARYIYARDQSTSEAQVPIIMITMEDVSHMIALASKLAAYSSQLERTLTTRTRKLEVKIAMLEKKIRVLNKKK